MTSRARATRMWHGYGSTNSKLTKRQTACRKVPLPILVQAQARLSYKFDPHTVLQMQVSPIHAFSDNKPCPCFAAMAHREDSGASLIPVSVRRFANRCCITSGQRRCVPLRPWPVSMPDNIRKASRERVLLCHTNARRPSNLLRGTQSHVIAEQ
jgi:hypothetical protein